MDALKQLLDENFPHSVIIDSWQAALRAIEAPQSSIETSP